MNWINLNTFADPMKDWGNHDILYDPKHRQSVKDEYPDIFKILDWPELRETFAYWENASKNAKLKARRYGLLAVFLGTIGLVSIAFAPLINSGNSLQGLLVAVGSIALVCGILIGFEHAYYGRYKFRWLEARYWAERTRQLYFQTFAFNLKLASEAITDEVQFSAWEDVRSDVLAAFRSATREKHFTSIERISSDVALRHWNFPNISKGDPEAAAFNCDERLTSYLDELRFGYQLDYAISQNLPGNLYSRENLSRKMESLANITTFALVAFASILAVKLFITSAMDQNIVVWLLAAQASAGAVIAACRVVEEGLGWRKDASRYAWYIENTKEIRAKYQSKSSIEKIAALKDFERLSYDELHQFIRAHLEAKFVI